MRSKSLLTLLAPILFLLGSILTPVSAYAQAEQTLETTQITRSLIEISRAERQNDLNLLYDLMLPEARLLIPRAAFANWWPTESPAAPADVITLDGIDFADVTYDLTGTDFGNVADVSYRYTDIDGNEVDSTIQLAEIGGVWRWMPDITQDDLPAIQSQAGYTVNFSSAFSTPLYQDLDTFWAQVFADWGLDYRSPVDMVGVRVAGTQTGCGSIENVDEVFAHYCNIDETIYFNPEMRDLIIDRIGDAAWEMVIAHEWGHHVQNIAGGYVTKSPELFGGSYSIEYELQADCLSGVFIQDATTRGYFDSRSIREIDEMTNLGGDATGTSWDDVDAHGTADQRRESFHTGFDDGLRGCNFDGTLDS